MTPTGGGGAAATQPAGPTAPTQTLSLGAGELESFDQLLGEWFGMMECDGEFEEIWFLADRALANGVSGFFRRGSFAGWGRKDFLNPGSHTSPGSASLTLLPDAESGGIRMRMAVRQYQNPNRDFADSFVLQLIGRDALYGTAASDACNEVNLGLQREGASD